MSKGEVKWRPPVGEISLDRVAISGSLGILDLFEGGNFYYQGYLSLRNHNTNIAIVENIANLRETLSLSVKGFIYLVVPNKASCLPENYPLWLPEFPTGAFKEVGHILRKIPGNLFGDWMQQGLIEDRKSLWLETDSHWSANGARKAAMEILKIISAPCPEVQRTDVYKEWGGDLSGRWGGGERFATEDKQLSFGFDSNRIAVFDNGTGIEHSAHSGRFLHWHNPAALVKMSLVVIGDSFSGTGLVSEHMTYWLSMVFSDTFFLHSSVVPFDLIDTIHPDFVVYQTNERFLRFPILKEYSFESLTQSFVDRVSEKISG